MADGLRRGDIVLVALSGSYGKPRPAVIVQDMTVSPEQSVIVCPLTSSIIAPGPVRPFVRPSVESSLRAESQIMVDKIVAVPTRKIGPRIGSLSTEDMLAVERALAKLLGFDAGT